MANYVIATSFGAKDALPSGDTNKIVKGTEIGNEFTAIATAINSKADLASPSFTGAPEVPTAALNDNSLKIANTAFVLQEINSAVAAGTEGLDGTSYLLVSVYRRSATTPTTPTGGSFDFSTLVLTPPTDWSRTIPTGTDPVYLSAATATSTGAPGVDSTLTWGAPVLVFQNGADGSGTDTKAANGYLYYGSSSSTAPTAPSANVDTYNYVFSTSTFSNVKAGWSTIFNSPSTSSGTSFWAVNYSVEEDENGVQTITIGGTPFRWLNFDGLVTFTNIQSSVASGVTSIDGNKIVTGTLTADKIAAGTVSIASGKNFSLGGSSTINGLNAVGNFSRTVSGGFAVAGTNAAGPSGAAGVVGAITNTVSGGWGVLGYYTGSSYSQAYGVGGLGTSGWGVEGRHYNAGSTSSTPLYEGRLGGSATGVQAYEASSGRTVNLVQNGWQITTNTSGTVHVAISGQSYSVYGFSGAGPAYFNDGVGPFTGVHDGVVDSSFEAEVGDIVVDEEFLHSLDVSNTIVKMSQSTTANQKGVVGVFVKKHDVTPFNWQKTIEKNLPAKTGTVLGTEEIEAVENTGGGVQQVLNPDYFDIKDYKVININGLGEGMINVCGQGGNIEIGDLIVTSNIPGKGMKQADDIIRGYTVAKARESVTFTSADEIKQIACIYVAG